MQAVTEIFLAKKHKQHEQREQTEEVAKNSRMGDHPGGVVERHNLSVGPDANSACGAGKLVQKLSAEILVVHITHYIHQIPRLQ